MTWTPDYKSEFDRRGRFFNRLREDPKLRAQVRLFYKYNPVQWINDICVTFDPRIQKPNPRLMPFILWQRQVDFILFLWSCLQDRENGLGEKCRDAGFTWLGCCFSLHQWLFWDGSAIGWGSRKEEYVDKKGDPKAIFPKIRQLIQYTPGFMLPADFNMREHAAYMKIINPANNATITGEAGDNIGRGGRTTMFFKDESAHYERPELIEAALGDNTDVQIDISSVNGPNNVFYRRRMAGEIWEPGKEIPKGMTRIFIGDWRDDPRKTQEWYDLRRARAEREGLLHVFAQEVDRDYSASLENIIIRPEWLEACTDAHVRLAEWGDWFSGEKIAGQDIADGGGDKNAVAGRHGMVLKFAEHWGGESDAAAKVALPYLIEYSIPQIYYDSTGVGAGFKGGVNGMKEMGAWPSHIEALPWAGAMAVQDPLKNVIPGDRASPKNEDHYLNLKAQSWFRLRAHAIKTYRAVHYGERCDVSEMMSIDSKMKNIHAVKMELGQAVYKHSQSGKVMVDKKPEGATSPNLGDAVVICYNPLRKAKGVLDI